MENDVKFVLVFYRLLVARYVRLVLISMYGILLLYQTPPSNALYPSNYLTPVPCLLFVSKRLTMTNCRNGRDIRWLDLWMEEQLQVVLETVISMFGVLQFNSVACWEECNLYTLEDGSRAADNCVIHLSRADRGRSMFITRRLLWYMSRNSVDIVRIRCIFAWNLGPTIVRHV